MQGQDEAWTVHVRADTRQLESALADADKLGNRFAQSLTRAFDAVAIRGKRLDDTVRALALSLSRAALKSALKPIEGAIGSAFSQIASGLVGAASRASLPSRSAIPFARGGVLDSPSYFPLSHGRVGVAGESGPEAILPLQRGRDGKLGVRAETAQRITINFNVTAADAASFKRSEGQIAAMLNRAVGRGHRNL